MNIIGLHWNINSSVALMQGGEVVSAVSEERFSRAKNDGRFPKAALAHVLDANGLDIGDIDIWALGSLNSNHRVQVVRRYCTFSIKDYVREMEQYWRPRLLEGKEPDYLEIFSDKIDRLQFPEAYWANPPDNEKDYRVAVLRDHLSIPEERIRRFEHHSCHAAYAFHSAPESLRNEDALVLTVDGFGDGLNATAARVSPDGRLDRFYQTNLANMGRLYRFFTLILGMKPNEHEYKMMGLAPYAKPGHFEEVSDLLAEYLWVKDGEFIQRKPFPDMYFTFRELLKHVRFDNIAAGIQHYVESILVAWIKDLVREHGLRTVMMSGGVAMNIKAMAEILERTEVERFHVPGNPADETNCIGAAYLAADGACTRSLRSLYLGGDAPVPRSLLDLARHKGFEVIEAPSVERIIHELAEYRIIGRCIGRMEFGARALGNRSILARCDREDIKPRINRAIKNRDFWMPFAPIILDSSADRYLINPKRTQSPHMTIGFKVTEDGAQCMRAAVHPADGTVRAQILERAVNPDLYDVLGAYQQRTGHGCLLNTSFNLHGYPIVRTAEDAFEVFENSDLDGLWLDGALVLR